MANRIKRNTESTAETDEQVVSDDQQEVTETDDAQAAAEFDASADAAKAEDNLFSAVFTVVAKTALNSPALKEFGEAVTVTVTRQRKGSYVASIGDVTGKESRKADVAVKRAIEAAGQRPNEFTYDAKAAEDEQAPLPERSNEQEAEVWFFDNPDSPFYKAAEQVSEEFIAADKKLTGAAIDTRDGWLGFGHAGIKLRLIFNDAGLVLTDGEAGKRGNTAWGTFIRTKLPQTDNVVNILAKKNAFAQAVFYASAPLEVVEAFPSVNTASTFERKTNEAVTAFAAAVAQSILTGRADREDTDTTLTVAQALEGAVRKHEQRVSNYDAAFAKWKEEAAKAAEKDKTIPKFEKARDKPDNLVIGWLLDPSEFEGSKLHKAIVAAWDEEVNKPSEEEKETAAAEKATKAIAKKFPEMSVDAAAEHLKAILVSHPDAIDVWELLGDKLNTALEAKANEEKAKKEAAEAEASAA